MQRTNLAFACLAAGIAAAQQQPSPDAAAQENTIADFRHKAVRYRGHLPDFICIETTTRSEGEKLKQRDVLLEQVAFSGGHEVIKLIAINGKPTTKNPLRVGGVIENSLLAGLIVPSNYFGAKAPVTLKWMRWDTLDGKPAQVISFTVAPSVTNYPDGKTPWLLGYHGLAWAGTADNGLLRIEADEDSPPHYPFKNNRTEVDYASVDIAGTAFILPVKAVISGNAGRSAYRNVVEFTKYRKFQADASVTFDESQ
jgi:hypothetical protein